MGKKILDSKLLYALLAIAIAVGIWVYVAVVENPDGKIDITGIPITFLNEETLAENGLMISDGRSQQVTLRVEGSWSTLAKLDQEKERISLFVDVGQIIAPGEQHMTYTVSLPSGYSNVTVRNRNPGSVDFTVSRILKKEIEVRGIFTGTLADGYMKDEFRIQPEKITVSGLEEQVKQISHALVTVEGEKLTDTVTGEMEFALISVQNKQLRDLDVTCSAQSVSVTMPVYQTADLPLTVKLIAGGGVPVTEEFVTCTIQPKSIAVSGSAKDLAACKEIVLGEIDLADIVGGDTLQMEIPLDSALVNLSGVTTAQVTVVIRGLETKTLKTDAIELVNVPRDRTARAVTQNVQVLLRGPADALAQVQPHHLRVVADLSQEGNATGRHTVTAEVYLDEIPNVGMVGSDYKIVVDLSR